MKNAAGIATLLIGVFLASPGYADDDADVDEAAAAEASADSTEALEALLESRRYAPEWRIDTQSILPLAQYDRVDALTALEFREASALERLVQLRTLSFVTLANSGKSRLFFGVNEDGYVGLHYRAVSAHPDSDHHEFTRLPHVDEMDQSATGQRY